MDFQNLFGDLYEFERLVAVSEERVLFLARDRLLKRRVSLRIHLRADVPGRAWFVREAEVLAMLDHPSIRHIYHAGEREALAYRVGNWIEGESLADAVARGPRPMPVVFSLARDLLYALDYAHVRGIVLRRVRPTTLMLDTSGRAVITDLRFANRVLDVVPPGEREDDDPFLAPEIRDGDTGDPSADIYTLGALLYYALTGVEPAERQVPIRELQPQTSPLVSRWVERALERSKADRYLTAAEMLAELAGFTDPFTAPASGGPSAILPDSPHWERRLRRALGDDYELVEALGSGSFGHVYRVKDLRLDRHVALKVLDPSLTEDPAIAEGFQREARLAAGLTHPNIVAIYAIDARLGLLWYTMELIEGRSVAQLVQKGGRLGVSAAVAVLSDALAALEYAHARRLVHRDIKPENLLLDSQERVHITDFGLALAIPRGRLFGGATSRSGTPQFAAPEQLAGGQVDARTDIFSLGAVGYFLLLGRPPFPERTLDTVLRGETVLEPPSIQAERDDIPELLEEALRRACAFEPADRFASTSAFAGALEAAGFTTGERQLPADGWLERILRRLGMGD